jgi:hypothetical protein
MFGSTKASTLEKGVDAAGSYRWCETVGMELERQHVDTYIDGVRRVQVLIFVKDSRRRITMHTHMPSLAGHVLDLNLDAIVAEQKRGWVSRRLKLSPRGYLTAKLRFEDAATGEAAEPAAEDYAKPNGAPLTALERHIRDHSPDKRERVDERRLEKHTAHGGPR